jgi:hypothetical protein
MNGMICCMHIWVLDFAVVGIGDSPSRSILEMFTEANRGEAEVEKAGFVLIGGHS